MQGGALAVGGDASDDGRVGVVLDAMASVALGGAATFCFVPKPSALHLMCI